MNNKAVVLLSGGLDSALAVKLMKDQGIDLTAVNFSSVFCTCTPKSAGCKNQAVAVARSLDIPIKVFHKGLDYLEIVKYPKYGYGRAMNPCIDCRIYIFKKAKQLMHSIEASFIITGEVMGQRRKSQKKHLMQIIEKEAGLERLIVRPLTAHNLPSTLPEEQGIVDREKLLSIQGRQRKKQLDLLTKFKIDGKFCPAGGCLLTDSNIAKKLKDLFEHHEKIDLVDLKLLKPGRYFRLNKHVKIIIGRNKEENEILKHAQSKNRTFLESVNFTGPSAIVYCKSGQMLYLKKASQLMASYSKSNVESFIVKVNSEKKIEIKQNKMLIKKLKECAI